MATIEKRHRKGGKIVYRVKIDIKGARCQSATFDRLTDARRWAQTTEGDIRDGRYFRTAEAKRHTLGEAIDKYSNEVLPQKAKGGANQTAQLTWWKKKLGDHTLADVTSADISEHRNFLLQEPKVPKSKSPEPDAVTKLRSPATVIRYLAALSHVFTVCIKEWGWTEDNPVGRVKMPKQSRGRVRFLSDTEREGLLTACQEINATLHLVVVLAISTGMRRGELMSLRWSQVDFERDAIVLLRTKNGDRRRVPLTGYAARLLREHGKVRKIDSALVFPGEVPDHPIELKRPWLPERFQLGQQPQWCPQTEADAVLAQSGAVIRHGGNRAFYAPDEDFIQLPPPAWFPEAEGYYATALHELTHWTGHASRLCRVLGRRQGIDAYAYEELVAEMGAAFLCAHCGIPGRLEHASYIDHWLDALKRDKRLIFVAAGAAQKAADFALGLSHAVPSPAVEVLAA